MRTATIHYFTEKEDGFIKILSDVGVNQGQARILIFLANINEATSRDIERGADVPQPQVSMAMKLLIEKGWISETKSKQNFGRPKNLYSLKKPIREIIDDLKKEKQNEMKRQLKMLDQLRDSLPE